jgi:Vps16, C-terminal region
MLTPLCAPETTRSPIGYEAFVRHLIEKGDAKEVVSFVQRCDANKRIDLGVECGECQARVRISFRWFSLKLLIGAVQEVTCFMSQFIHRPEIGSNRIYDEVNPQVLHPYR